MARLLEDENIEIEESGRSPADTAQFPTLEEIDMANWWEEKDEFGYTYADKNRPGYMGPVPKEEKVQISEEEVEGFHEDFYEEDEVSEDDKSFVQKEFMDVDLTDEQKKLSRVLEDEKSPDVGLPQEEITPFAKQLECV